MCFVSPSPAFLNSSVPKHHTDHTPGCMGAAPTAAMGWSSTKTQPNPYFKQSSASFSGLSSQRVAYISRLSHSRMLLAMYSNAGRTAGLIGHLINIVVGVMDRHV